MRTIHFRYTYAFAILLICTGYLYLFSREVSEINPQHTLCLFHQVTGLPCPACGTGRALVCILDGEFSKAWLFNPLAYVVLIFSFVAVTWMMIDLKKNRFTFFPVLKKPVPIRYLVVPILVLLVNWYWTIRKGL